MPEETKEEDPGFQLEEWLLEQFKNDTLLMEKRDPFWSSFVTQPEPPPGKKKPKHRDGPFSWLVRLGKLVLGESNLDKIRGSLIAKHSQVIRAVFMTQRKAGCCLVGISKLRTARSHLYGSYDSEERRILQYF